MIRLYDTNHAIAHLNGDPRLTAHLSAARSAGDSCAITTTVLSELYYGAYASQRVADNMMKLKAFASQIIIYEFGVSFAEEFGKIKAEQRAKGKPMQTADAQIAAVARRENLTLLTNDTHFLLVDNLALENWLM